MNLYDRYVYWRLGPAARLVYKAFENPDAWEIETHTIMHKPSQLRFWVANDYSHFRLYKPHEIDCFTNFERKVLWSKYEQLKTMYLFVRMAGMN